jgi:hypothetical protein
MESKFRDLCAILEELRYEEMEIDWSLIPDANRLDLVDRFREFGKQVKEFNDSVGVYDVLGFMFVKHEGEGYYDILDCYGMIRGGLSEKDGDELVSISNAPNSSEYELVEGAEAYTLLHKGVRVKTYYP